MWRRSYGFLGILTALCNFYFLAICDDAEEKAEKIRILIVSGGASHDFSRQLEILKLGLQERVGEEIEWSVRLEDSGRGDIESGIFAENWAGEVDLVIHFHCFPRVGDPDFIDRVLEPHRNGLPAVILHGALQSFRTSEDRWFDFCGVQLGSHAKSSEVEVQVMGINHPVAEINDPWTSPHEELYFVDEVGTGTTILAEGRRFSEGATHESEPVIWVHEYGPSNARVFASSLGNDEAGLSIPKFLDMTARGLLWALGEEASDCFVDIAPEDSLKGLPEKRKTHHFLNHGFSILQEGTSNAMSEDRADGHLAEFALDGRSESYWRAASPGPSVWEVSLAAPAQVSGLAIEWLDSLPQEYLVEGSTDATNWFVLGKGGGDLGEAPRSLHYFPTQSLRSVRVTFPTTRPHEHPGIREISGYRSRKDIPAAWALEAGLNDGLRVAAPPFASKSLRLHPDWELDSRETAIPSGLRPVELEECANGSLFLLAENAASERSVLHFTDNSSATVFLGGLHPSATITWDGEWIYLLEDFQLSKLRDTNSDGIADERRRIGTLRRADGSSLPAISQMQLVIDGWIYAISESEAERGVIRFRRDGSGFRHFVSSKLPIVSFRTLGGLAFETQARTESGSLDVRLVRHGAFPGRPLESFPRLSEQNFSFESKGDFVFSSWSEKESRLIFEAPGLQSVFATEKGFMAVIEQGGEMLALRLKPSSDGERRASVDLDKIPDLELFPLFSSSSPSLQREAVFEVQRRRANLEEQAIALLQDRQSPSYLPSLALLSQIDGERSFALLSDAARLSHQAIAYRLLGDREEAHNHQVFSEVTSATDPKVTAEILAAIARSESNLKGLERLVLSFVAVDEEELSRTAIEWLVRVGKGVPEVCFEVIDDSEATLPLREAAFLVLARHAHPDVVEGLSQRLAKAGNPRDRRQFLHSLCQIYQQEGETWSGSLEVAETLQAALRDRRVDAVWLLDQMQKNSIPVGDLAGLATLAADQFPLQATLVSLMIGEKKVPASAIHWLEDLVSEKSHDPSLRAKAASLLNRSLSFSEMYRLSSDLLEAPLMRESEQLLFQSWKSREDLGERVSFLSSKLKSGTLSEQRLAQEVLAAFDTLLKDAKSETLSADDIYEMGFEVFARLRCDHCHNVHGEGDFVGPDLVSWMGKNQAEALTTALRNPGKSVREHFRPEVIELETGSRIRGLVTQISEDRLEVVDEAGNRILLEPKEIISRKPESGSLMPAFPEDSISPEEQEALIHFLRGLGRFPSSK